MHNLRLIKDNILYCFKPLETIRHNMLVVLIIKNLIEVLSADPVNLISTMGFVFIGAGYWHLVGFWMNRWLASLLRLLVIGLMAIVEVFMVL